MRNQEKVIVLFCFNMGGWCLLSLPTLPGEPRPTSLAIIAYTLFNLASAFRCHLWLTDKR